MAGKARGTLRGMVAALALLAPVPVAADGLAGAYLAARQASFTGDFKAAAQYYAQAATHDPTNTEIIERATYAHIGLGEIDAATALADRLTERGVRSQIGTMAQVATMARDEDYAAILASLKGENSIGPLVDGLVIAWAELGGGNMDAARAAFDAVAQDRGLAGFAAYHKAMALASVGDFGGAEAIFASSQTGGMQLTRRGIMARAEILSQLGQPEQAADLIEEAFGQVLDPELRALHDRLASGEALPFSGVRSPRDGIAEVFYTLAGALADEADEDFTLLYARIADFLRPDNAGAILMTADLLDQLGQYDLAATTYRRVPREDPNYHIAEMGRADALRAEDKMDAAVEVLEQLAETHGNQPAVHSALGDLLRQLERYDAAVAAYDRALGAFERPDPAQWFLYYARGISKERLDDWPAAEADFREALELNPDQPQVLNYLGYSLVEHQQNLDEALAMIERAVAAQPQAGYIVDSLGWALYRLGRYDEAVGHMERAAELMAVDPVVNDHLGDVYWAVARHTEARFQWQRALSFVDWEEASEELDPDRIRRKLEVGLDQVLSEEGAPPLKVANDVH